MPSARRLRQWAILRHETCPLDSIWNSVDRRLVSDGRSVSHGVLAFMVTLKLGRTSKYFGIGDKNDFVVLRGGRVIGRILRPPEAPENEPWFWTITDPEKMGSVHNSGYSETREQAIADFKTRWLAAL
jgi:hypothetical protein